MKRGIVIFFILAMYVQAATLEVGSSKPYKTIQSAVDAAKSGDTILVYDGVYKEKLISTKSLTIQSKNLWGAVIDGEGVRNAGFFQAGVKLIGFKVTNCIPYTDCVGNYCYPGILNFYKDADNFEVKYCNFISNNLTGGAGNTGIIKASGTSSPVIRGNVFQNNVFGWAGDGGPVTCGSCTNGIIELNKFLDISSPSPYSIYATSGTDMVIRSNYIKNAIRCRSNGGTRRYRLENNVFEGMVLLFDQIYGTDIDNLDDHKLSRNTFYTKRTLGAPIDSVSMRGMTVILIDSNVFVRNDISSQAYAIGEIWADANDISIVDNYYDSSGFRSFIDPDLDGDVIVNNGNKDDNPSYDPATGWHNRLGSNQGADLKIDVYPMTTQGGSALTTDYPYGGSQPQSCPGDCCSSGESCTGTIVAYPDCSKCCVGGACQAASLCGNSMCDSSECVTCPGDCDACADCGQCGPVCGDGDCQADESCSSCPQDCGDCEKCLGLLHLYRFDGDAKDSAGGDVATVYGAAPVQGLYSQAYSFDGVDDYLSLPSGSKYSADYTVSFWMKTQDSGTVFSFREDPKATDYLAVKMAAGKPEFRYVTYINDIGYAVASISVDDGNWHHIAAVRDGARTAKLYVDGALAAQDNDDSGSAAGIDSPHVISVGRDEQTGSDFFEGMLDELAIWDRALTAQEVAQMSQAQEPLACGHHPADLDGNGCIDIVELIQYMDKWKRSEVDMQGLMGAIKEWKQGC